MGKQTYNNTKIYNTVKLRQDVKKKIEKQPKLFFFFNILISKILFLFLQFKIVFLLLFFCYFFKCHFDHYCVFALSDLLMCFGFQSHHT